MACTILEVIMVSGFPDRSVRSANGHSHHHKLITVELPFGAPRRITAVVGYSPVVESNPAQCAVGDAVGGRVDPVRNRNVLAERAAPLREYLQARVQCLTEHYEECSAGYYPIGRRMDGHRQLRY